MVVHGFLFKNSDRFRGPWIPESLLKIRTNLAVHGSLYPFLKIRAKMAVHGCLFQNSDQFRGPWIPESLFKIRTNSTVHGFLHPLLKFGPNWRSVNPFLKFGPTHRPWIFAFIFKIRTNLGVCGFLPYYYLLYSRYESFCMTHTSFVLWIWPYFMWK